MTQPDPVSATLPLTLLAPVTPIPGTFHTEHNTAEGAISTNPAPLSLPTSVSPVIEHPADVNVLQAPISLTHYGARHTPAIITRNNFIHKSLSCWSLNLCVGCPFACRFCYVPGASTRKLGGLDGPLTKAGVEHPDAEWGEYVFLRRWDEDAFVRSLKQANQTPLAELSPDSNRAVILSSTSDPFMIIAGPDPVKNRGLNAGHENMLSKALELTRDKSSINLRILTRSPLARKSFDLFKTFGNRLAFGMSLPTLDNQLARIYEPRAPAPSQRLATLRAARDAGLNVFVAMAPTYPECDERDLSRTLLAIKELDPITIFHEPINIRAENVERIATHARSIGCAIRTDVFETRTQWMSYALDSLRTVQRLAQELGIIERLHLWPDATLATESVFLAMRREAWRKNQFSKYEQQQCELSDRRAYQEHRDWLARWWSRISEWPGEPRGRRMVAA
jgi:DNA repair photolyase